MNTTTNTRGVSGAMVERIEGIMREDCPGSTETQIKETALRIAALSAPEPAAQGDVGPVVAWMTKAGRVINTETRERVLADAELGGEYIAAAKAAEAYCIPLYTAPPAQPAERVPEAVVVPYGSESGEKDYAYGYEKGRADGWNACRDAMLTASPAPSEGVKGVEG